MRREDSTPTVTDLPGVGGLSGVRADNPDRKPQEVSPALEKVAKRKLTIADLTLDEKLAVLNAFRAIRNNPPKVKDPQAKTLIEEMYNKWIDDTMLQILNPSSVLGGGFTPAEADALKVLAQTILQRQQGSAARPAPAPMVPRTGANSKPQPAPIVSGVDDVEYRKAQENFLRELSKLEREGPTF